MSPSPATTTRGLAVRVSVTCGSSAGRREASAELLATPDHEDPTPGDVGGNSPDRRRGSREPARSGHVACAAMSGERITIGGGRTELVVEVGEDGRLHQRSLGDPAVPVPELGLPTALYPLAYPTFGEELLREPALRVTHADGSPSTRLVFEGAAEEPHAGGTVHRVGHGRSGASAAGRPVLAHLARLRPDRAVGRGHQRGRRRRAPSTRRPRPRRRSPGVDPWFTHWGGGWANEWTETTEPLTSGTKTVASAGGVRSSLHRPPIVLLRRRRAGRPRPTGSVLAATVAWGGDTRFDAEVGRTATLRLIAGAQHRGAERTLEPGERFTSPPAALVWSDHGIGPTSRALHRFGARAA